MNFNKNYFQKPYYILLGALMFKFGKDLRIPEESIRDLNRLLKLGGKYDGFSDSEGNPLKDITSAIRGKNPENTIDYNSDHSKVFFNYGKAILLSCMYNSNLFWSLKNDMSEIQKDDADYNGFIDYQEEIHGIIDGLVSGNDINIKSIYNETLNEFENEDKIVSSPVIPVKELIGKVDSTDSEFLITLLVGVHYILMGFSFSYINSAKLKELLYYGEKVNFNSKDVLNFIEELPKEKLNNYLRFATIYDELVMFIEDRLGFSFNDRFSEIFCACGKLGFKLLTKEFNDFTSQFNPNIKFYEPSPYNNNPVAMVRLLVNNIDSKFLSNVTGYYIKSLYQHLSPEGKYTPPFENLSEKEVMMNDRAVINGAESRIISTYLLRRLMLSEIKIRKLLNSGTISDEEYIRLTYKLRAIELLIYDCVKEWTKDISKRKDPMFVSVEKNYGYIKVSNIKQPNKLISINETSYSETYCIAKKEIEFLVLKYLEWFEYSSSKNKKVSLNYYKKLGFDEVIPHDSLEDAVNKYKFGELPYLFTLGQYSDRELDSYSNYTDRLKMFNLLDIEYEELKEFRPFSTVFFHDAISPSTITNTELTKKLVKLLEDITNEELVQTIK